MIKAVIFGGTTEGRRLCAFCSEHAVPALYCVATADGARPVEGMPHVDVRTGRLDLTQMTALLRRHSSALVLDATHPYAEQASRTIKAACRSIPVPLLRVTREGVREEGCVTFSRIDDLLARLEREPGNIFVSTGSSLAEAFASLPDYQSRVWMRILPNRDSLDRCLKLGYRPDRLICMQGPFSEELNYAMFQTAEASILVTKNSGAAGGFPAKIRAARRLGMFTAVLARPEEAGGISWEEGCRRMMEWIT